MIDLSGADFSYGHVHTNRLCSEAALDAISTDVLWPSRFRSVPSASPFLGRAVVVGRLIEWTAEASQPRREIKKRENEAEMKSIGPILFVGCLFDWAASLVSLGNLYVVSRS